ncbi:8-oxo-dGTP pyrophosphatase MutT (NUDIX family) [Conyzicola nivalis]|uniref:8-oxo-dGTP pyrophosphatase MutT (NUDIX family) n=1 Tax=Conyzicola nivalis TaxID=1477021 RepID=A0ABV2QS92_9MICO
MATPDFVLALREKIGHHPLWLSGVTAVVVRDSEVLLVRRSDTGEWTPVTGIVDPGEQPAVAAERETLEEANIVAVAEAISWVQVTEPIRYANGDESQYIDLVFRCRYVSGDPYPADGENTDAAWFPLDALPTMTANMEERIRSALEFTGATRFER